MLIELDRREGKPVYRLLGAWRAASVRELDEAVTTVRIDGPGPALLDASGLESIDLTGAHFVERLSERLRAAGVDPGWEGSPPESVAFERATLSADQAKEEAEPAAQRSVLAVLGMWTVDSVAATRNALAFLGSLTVAFLRGLRVPRHLRIPSVVRHVSESGLQAVPIVALIAFLISVIVAYIGAQELQQFGGQVFVVDLVALSVLRELGVLLTAIIVAGRSGSAYAAEIGVMQLNEEVDALGAMGVNAVEVLVLPRVIGLVIALPLLTVIADAMGLAGGAVLSWLVLGIPFNQFAIRTQEALATTTFWAGLLKAPVFAALIALVGTYRGLQVHGSSRELGRRTTQAVVESIFLVLLADAIFAVVYWQIDF